MRGDTSRVATKNTQRRRSDIRGRIQTDGGEKLMNENNRCGGKGVCYSRDTEGHGHGNASTSSANRDEFNPQRVDFHPCQTHRKRQTQSRALCTSVINYLYRYSGAYQVATCADNKQAYRKSKITDVKQ